MKRAYFHASSIVSITSAIVGAIWHLFVPVVDEPVDAPWTDGT